MSTLDAFTREYSKRLGVLTGAQLQAALDQFDLGRLLSATPAPGGFSGQNVFLTTTRGEFVLRGCPHYDWQFKRERFFSRVIHEETDVPTAWPYLIEPSEDIFSWSFAIMPRLSGIRSASPEVEGGHSGAAGTATANALGAGLARLHRATRPEPAVYDPAIDALRPRSGEPGPLPMWSWWGFQKSTPEFLAECVRSGVVSANDGSWAQAIVDLNSQALKVPFTPTLVHHDYKQANVVLGLGEKAGASMACSTWRKPTSATLKKTWHAPSSTTFRLLWARRRGLTTRKQRGSSFEPIASSCRFAPGSENGSSCTCSGTVF